MVSAMMATVQKHAEDYDGALFELPDWFHQLVRSAASGLKINRSIAL